MFFLPPPPQYKHKHPHMYMFYSNEFDLWKIWVMQDLPELNDCTITCS
jgi:hypothetical protein